MEFFDQNKPFKILLRMCIPSVITILIMQIYHMADVFFIGKLGSTAMVSGLSLSSPIIALLSTIGVLFGVGGCSALAISLGKKEEKHQLPSTPFPSGQLLPVAFCSPFCSWYFRTP